MLSGHYYNNFIVKILLMNNIFVFFINKLSKRSKKLVKIIKLEKTLLKLSDVKDFVSQIKSLILN